MNILVICAIGITSSILSDKIRAELPQLDINIKSSDVNSAKYNLEIYDLVIVLPQIEFVYKEVKEKCERMNIDCILVDQQRYTKGDFSYIVQMIKSSYISLKKENVYLVLQDSKCALSQLYIKKLKKMLSNEKYNVNEILLKEIENIEDGSFVILEPKLMFKENELNEKLKNKNIILHYLFMSDYASLNVETVLKKLVK